MLLVVVLLPAVAAATSLSYNQLFGDPYRTVTTSPVGLYQQQTDISTLNVAYMGLVQVPSSKVLSRTVFTIVSQSSSTRVLPVVYLYKHRFLAMNLTTSAGTEVLLGPNITYDTWFTLGISITNGLNRNVKIFVANRVGATVSNPTYVSTTIRLRGDLLPDSTATAVVDSVTAATAPVPVYLTNLRVFPNALDFVDFDQFRDDWPRPFIVQSGSDISGLLFEGYSGAAVSCACPNNLVIAAVQAAYYGRPRGIWPNAGPSSSCDLGQQAVNVVQQACLGKNSCVVPSTNDKYGSDPCPGYSKWAIVALKCDTFVYPTSAPATTPMTPVISSSSRATPTAVPSPTATPSLPPSAAPTLPPSSPAPSPSPTLSPSPLPTVSPSPSPTLSLSPSPTMSPSPSPTVSPPPSPILSSPPSSVPTLAPKSSSQNSSPYSSPQPSLAPTFSSAPTRLPSGSSSSRSPTPTLANPSASRTVPPSSSSGLNVLAPSRSAFLTTGVRTTQPSASFPRLSSAQATSSELNAIRVTLSVSESIVGLPDQGVMALTTSLVRGMSNALSSSATRFVLVRFVNLSQFSTTVSFVILPNATDPDGAELADSFYQQMQLRDSALRSAPLLLSAGDPPVPVVIEEVVIRRCGDDSFAIKPEPCPDAEVLQAASDSHSALSTTNTIVIGVAGVVVVALIIALTLFARRRRSRKTAGPTTYQTQMLSLSPESTVSVQEMKLAPVYFDSSQSKGLSQPTMQYSFVAPEASPPSQAFQPERNASRALSSHLNKSRLERLQHGARDKFGQGAHTLTDSDASSMY